MTRLEKVRQLIDTADCGKRQKTKVLKVFREFREQQEAARDSLVESVEALPLGIALRMGLVKPALETYTPENAVVDAELSQMLEEILQKISPLHKRVIKAIFLEQENPYSLCRELKRNPEWLGPCGRRALTALQHAVDDTPELRSRLAQYLH